MPLKPNIDLLARYQLPIYYNPLNLPEANVCRVFIFQDSGWEPTGATIREAFDSDRCVRKVRILTETGVCDSIVAKCRALLDKLESDIEIEVESGHTHDELAFRIGYLDCILYLHCILRN